MTFTAELTAFISYKLQCTKSLFQLKRKVLRIVYFTVQWFTQRSVPSGSHLLEGRERERKREEEVFRIKSTKHQIPCAAQSSSSQRRTGGGVTWFRVSTRSCFQKYSTSQVKPCMTLYRTKAPELNAQHLFFSHFPGLHQGNTLPYRSKISL